MRISDWSSDVCSSDLVLNLRHPNGLAWYESGRSRRRAPIKGGADPASEVRAGQSANPRICDQGKDAMADKSARSRLIGQVVQVAQKRLPANPAKRAEPFLRAFFANVPRAEWRGGGKGSVRQS